MHREALRAIPEKYDRCLGPLFFRPYARELAKRILSDPCHSSSLSGQQTHVPRVLDLACGTGILSEELSRADVTGLDSSASMLRQAASKSLSGTKLVRGQAETLPFAAAAFDAIGCGFGLMFFDASRALAEATRVLRSGGRFYASIWNGLELNEAASLANRIARSFFPANPPPFFEVPYSMPVTKASAILTAAGFEEVNCESVQLSNDPISASEAAIGLMEGNPILARIMERDESVLPRIVDAVAQGLEAQFGSPMRANMSATILSATKAASSR
jgi:SAM-dependent methyltransferase